MAKDTLKKELNLTHAEIVYLLSSLNLLFEQVKAGTLTDPGTGICFNWTCLIEEGVKAGSPYQIIRYVSEYWPGSDRPGQRSYSPIRWEGDSSPLWKGTGLAARLSLMRYTRKRLKDFLRRTPKCAG